MSQSFCESCEFIHRIGTKARYESVTENRDWRQRNDIRPKEARPSKWQDERRKCKGSYGHQQSQQNCQQGALRHFKYADPLVALNGIAKNGARLLWTEVVKTREHRAKSIEVLSNTYRIDRVRMDNDPALAGSAHAFKCIFVWIFISKTNSDVEMVPLPQGATKS
jgi:hypothetical protein